MRSTRLAADCSRISTTDGLAGNQLEKKDGRSGFDVRYAEDSEAEGLVMVLINIMITQ